MSYPTIFTTPGIGAFAEAVDAERQRQLARWGDQRHPDGTGPDRVWAFTGPASYVAACARQQTEDLAAEGHATWTDIALEEVAEALAESDPAKLRAELVQVAAVCAAWISDIDRRPATAAPVPVPRIGRPTASTIDDATLDDLYAQLAEQARLLADVRTTLNDRIDQYADQAEALRAELAEEQRVSAERGRYLADVGAALIAAGQDEGGGYIAYARCISQLAAERNRLAATVKRMERTNRMVNGEARDSRLRAEQAEAAVQRVRELHQPHRGACGTCADEDGQAARWPCATHLALDDPGTAAPTPDRPVDGSAEVKQLRAQLADARAAVGRTVAEMERCNALARQGGERSARVNARQVINLLSPTWPDGNYAAPAPADAPPASN